MRYILLLIFSLLIQSLLAICSFEQGMGPEYQVTTDHWGAYNLKTLYEMRNYEIAEYSEIPLIPKIIHQIWIGPEIPKKFNSMMASWKRLNPNWEYKLWTNADIASFPMANREQFERAENLGMKSDIWRYEILKLYGGVYVDVDVECLQPLDVLHHTSDFYACYGGAGYIQNCIIGSACDHPILEHIINDISTLKIPSGPIGPDKVMAMTGPWFLGNTIIHLLKIDFITPYTIIYPLRFFLPLPPSKRHHFWNSSDKKALIEQYVTEDSFMVHYWAESWVPK